MIKKWQELDWAKCDYCGSSSIIALTSADKGGFVYDKDYVLCTECAAKGDISTYDFGRAKVVWRKVPHKKDLSECMAHHEHHANVRKKHAKETRKLIGIMDHQSMSRGEDYENDIRDFNLKQAEFDEEFSHKHQKWAVAICEAIKNPQYHDDLQINVFYQNGDPPFICGIKGKATISILTEIEQDMIDNLEIFNRGNGDYLFSTKHQQGQQSFPETGQWDFPPHWEFDLIAHQQANS
jgi:hypothetical protein